MWSPVDLTLPSRVEHIAARRVRQSWQDEAIKRDGKGQYADSEKHLLRWFLAGLCESFDDRERGERHFAAIWAVITNAELMGRLVEHPILSLLLKLLDRGINPRHLTERIPQLKYTCMIVVTTDGRVLSRSDKGGIY
jgi:hypothetical protein